MIKVLFACSELFPLVKTGGLADFSYALSLQLKRLACDPIVLVPGYRELLKQLPKAKLLQKISLDSSPYETELLAAIIPGSRQTIWIVNTPELYDRPGSLYVDETGEPWQDNDQRFCHFSRIAVEVAMGRTKGGWKADVIHCNDWQTGLIPALLSTESPRPATLFTIHNLAYQGNFSRASLYHLGLGDDWWDMEKLEFYNQLSFMKGGLVYADLITTVSPTYAKEILSPEQGYGFDGLLRYREKDIYGILNGVDYKLWNPAKDPYIEYPFNINSLESKEKNKRHLQEMLSFKKSKTFCLVGFVGRLAHQKGIDLLLELITRNIDKKVQWAILGNGDRYYEEQLAKLAEQYPDRISISFDYCEEQAHRIEASADLFMMPSYYEPCGLNQMYSLRYATLPVVSETGGLVDTVVHSCKETIADGSATGFMFPAGEGDQLNSVLKQALKYFRNKKVWTALQKNAMKQRFSWEDSAKQYIELYHLAIEKNSSVPISKIINSNSTLGKGLLKEESLS